MEDEEMTTDYAAARFAAGNMPAFPCEAQGDRPVPPEHDYLQTGIHSAKFPGMTLRDYFAGQALAGLLANSNTPDQLIGLGYLGAKKECAEYCYAAADAMLTARERTTDAEG
jgi:hypothetical protein